MAGQVAGVGTARDGTTVDGWRSGTGGELQSSPVRSLVSEKSLEGSRRRCGGSGWFDHPLSPLMESRQ